MGSPQLSIGAPLPTKLATSVAPVVTLPNQISSSFYQSLTQVHKNQPCHRPMGHRAPHRRLYSLASITNIGLQSRLAHCALAPLPAWDPRDPRVPLVRTLACSDPLSLRSHLPRRRRDDASPAWIASETVAATRKSPAVCACVFRSTFSSTFRKSLPEPVAPDC
jgi:hypothetical protein